MRPDSSNRGEAPRPRIAVLGSKGSGKTAISKRFASELDMPRVELDSLIWEASWTPADKKEVFRGRVEAATAGDCRVVDGNYIRARDVVGPRATTIVWLDYPLRATRRYGTTSR